MPDDTHPSSPQQPSSGGLWALLGYAGSGFQRLILLTIVGTGLALGVVAWIAGAREIAHGIWSVATLPVLMALLMEIVTHLRRGHVGLDVIAALAMAGALVFGESLAAALVGLMYAGGQFLEAFAEGRAQREMTQLLSRVPKTALRHSRGKLEEVPVEAIVPGDRVLIRTGDAVPADGTIVSGAAVLDQSTLTGESIPASRRAGESVLSGSLNIGAAFDLLVARPPADSAYAGIVRLVEAAQQTRSPLVRLADRYALWFLAATVAITAATWLATGDPIRALAVLVVATPCPLILGVPVAIISGVSRIARCGVLVKGGTALETLARVRTIVFDKTGTLTEGRARLVAIDPSEGFSPDEVLRLAATLDQASIHVVATALVGAAQDRGLSLGNPTGVREEAGVGIEGMIENRRVAVGGGRYVARLLEIPASPSKPQRSDGAFSVAVAVDGVLAGHLILSDEIRGDVPGAIRRFRAAGVSKIVLASGDRSDIAQSVGSQLDIDEIRGSLAPQDKVEIILRERSRGTTMMVGDGVNDAPALAAADVGVALGARGAAASAEVADVVLLVDHVDRLAEAIEIAQRSRRIALESAVVGIGLSAVAMAAAAFGLLPPVQGALVQEAIDVGVVLNALRALGGPKSRA